MVGKTSVHSSSFDLVMKILVEIKIDNVLCSDVMVSQTSLARVKTAYICLPTSTAPNDHGVLTMHAWIILH